jgi:hypothetical protein
VTAPASVFGSGTQWIGPHSAISLSKVLKKIACEEKSGDLQVSFGSGTKTIYLKDGNVVFAASDISHDRLGETMLERGSISEYEYILASGMMKREGRKFGEALVRIGLINQDELERQLRHQFNHIVLSLFQVREGIYSFEERSPSIPNDLMVELAIPYLLLDGLRSVPDDRMLFSCLPFPRSKLRSTTRPFSTFDVRMLAPEELAVLRAAQDGVPLETILSEVGGDTRNVLRLCGALSVLGFLEIDKEEEGQDDLGAIITTTFDQTESMTEIQTLEVEPGAGFADIERAYTLKRLEWSRIHHLVKGDPDLESKASEIQFRLAAAYHRLLDDEQPLPVKRKTVYPQESSRVEADPKSRTEAKNPFDRVKERELLDAVKVHFKAQNWGAAIPVLFELVEMAPKNARYRGFLAKAMFKHPAMREKAERHFLEAIQIKPLDPKLHMWLGVYYKSLGQDTRATVAFRTTLELDPDNSVAKKFLLDEESESIILC